MKQLASDLKQSAVSRGDEICNMVILFMVTIGILHLHEGKLRLDLFVYVYFIVQESANPFDM